MKNLFVTIALVLLSNSLFSQLKGSGKTITKSFNYENFDKLSFEDVDGTIEVEVGKPFQISITIDDNLFPLLEVLNNVSDKSLTIRLKGNRNNKLYIEYTKIKIKVCLPNLIYLKNDSNSYVKASGISGNYLKVETIDNGSTLLTGEIDNLETKNSGNGVLDSAKLVSKNAKIIATGNGNVTVNTSKLITATTSGNCTVINLGTAKFDSNSTSTGNSRFTNQ